MMILASLLSLLLSAFVVTARHETIVEIAVGSNPEQFNTLVAAVRAAGLVDALNSAGPFTVFAPTDEAFGKLPEGTIESLLEDVETLKNILLYHVVPMKVVSGDLAPEQSVGTLLGSQSLIVLADEQGVTVNGANVVIPDIEASNGVIHVIDEVLIPQVMEMEMSEDSEDPPMTIVDVALSFLPDEFNILVEAVVAAGLVDALKSDGPFTVFAPTDEAFGKLSEGTLASLVDDKEALTQVLLYHVVPGKIESGDLAPSQEVETLQGQTVLVLSDHGCVTVENANVVIPDVGASNGVIHVIDEVLIPSSMNMGGDDEEDTEPGMTVVDIAVGANPDEFNILVAAVKAADLVGALMGDGPFTVFAPTDEAFGKLPEGAISYLLENTNVLAEVLLYHVVSGKVMSGDLGYRQRVPTLQGQRVVIKSDVRGVTVDGFNVIQADIEASNGVIHIIDEVLLPNNLDIGDGFGTSSASSAWRNSED